MINKIKQIKKKFLKINLYKFIIKLGIQKKYFLNKSYLLKNCLVNTWIKIIKKNKKIYLYGYSNSLFITGIIKIISKIFNNNNINNIILLYKFDIFKIINFKKIISDVKKNSLKTILNYIKFIL